MAQFILPNSDARIDITNLSESAKANKWNCTFKVLDTKDEVINGQEFSVVEFYVPATESNKELYIAQHFQSYVFDGLIWLAAITASQSE